MRVAAKDLTVICLQDHQGIVLAITGLVEGLSTKVVFGCSEEEVDVSGVVKTSSQESNLPFSI